MLSNGFVGIDNGNGSTMLRKRSAIARTCCGRIVRVQINTEKVVDIRIRERELPIAIVIEVARTLTTHRGVCHVP